MRLTSKIAKYSNSVELCAKRFKNIFVKFLEPQNLRNRIYTKIPKMNLFENLEVVLIKFQKKIKKRGQALLGRPASLSAQPAARPASPSSLSPARDARLAPSRGGHVAAIRRRWARRGRPPPPPWSRRRPASPDALSILSPVPSPSFLRPRTQLQQQQLRPRHCWKKLRRSPPVAPELQARRQGHQRTRRRRGKPLRTLYRGEK